VYFISLWFWLRCWCSTCAAASTHASVLLARVSEFQDSLNSSTFSRPSACMLGKKDTEQWPCLFESCRIWRCERIFSSFSRQGKLQSATLHCGAVCHPVAIRSGQHVGTWVLVSVLSEHPQQLGCNTLVLSFVVASAAVARCGEVGVNVLILHHDVTFIFACNAANRSRIAILALSSRNTCISLLLLVSRTIYAVL
jgi:hypothetical protein